MLTVTGSDANFSTFYTLGNLKSAVRAGTCFKSGSVCKNLTGKFAHEGGGDRVNRVAERRSSVDPMNGLSPLNSPVVLQGILKGLNLDASGSETACW